LALKGLTFFRLTIKVFVKEKVLFNPLKSNHGHARHENMSESETTNEGN